MVCLRLIKGWERSHERVAPLTEADVWIVLGQVADVASKKLAVLGFPRECGPVTKRAHRILTGS
jgi:hypothetical protein